MESFVSGAVVGASRSRFRRARSWTAIFLGLSAEFAAAQDVVTQPRVAATPPENPSLITPRPDIVVRQGQVSAGMTGKLVLARETDFSRNLHSTWSGALSFDSPGEWNRSGDVGVHKGFLLWTLRDRRGFQAGIGLVGDPASTTVHGNLEVPLPASIALDAHAQSRCARGPEGGVRIDHATVGLRRHVTRSLIVHPRMYVYEVHAHDDIRWIGTTMQVEYLGAELALNSEGARGSRVTTRKSWQRGTLRWTLGGHLERHPIRADRSLWECAVSTKLWSVSVYPGDTQRGVLVRGGAIQIGFSQRPRASQTVLGFKNVSLSMLACQDGKREFGLGFVYGGLLRGVAQTATGWQWRPAHHRSAADDPRVRWPGLATLAD